MSEKSFNKHGVWSPPGGKELHVDGGWEPIMTPESTADCLLPENAEFARRIEEALDPSPSLAEREKNQAATIGRIASILADVNQQAFASRKTEPSGTDRNLDIE